MFFLFVLTLCMCNLNWYCCFALSYNNMQIEKYTWHVDHTDRLRFRDAEYRDARDTEFSLSHCRVYIVWYTIDAYKRTHAMTRTNGIPVHIPAANELRERLLLPCLSGWPPVVTTYFGLHCAAAINLEQKRARTIRPRWTIRPIDLLPTIDFLPNHGKRLLLDRDRNCAAVDRNCDYSSLSKSTRIILFFSRSNISRRVFDTQINQSTISWFHIRKKYDATWTERKKSPQK